MTNLQKLAAEIAQQFAKIYGRPPRWIVAAPGRVNVIGEHTDYNDGYVLPMAIEHYAIMAADRSADGKSAMQIRDTSGAETTLVDLSVPLQPGEPKWGNYPRGVIAGFLELGLNPGGLDVLLHSIVPMGGGLSSSAALEVATATLIEVVTGKKIDPVTKALLCQKAENDFAGVPCGIMDQFVSVMGRASHLLLLDCRSRKTELVPMSDASVSLMIINTNVKHELIGGGYAERRKQCEQAARILGVSALRDATPETLECAKDKMEEVVFRRARHVISEIERTVHAAEGVRASNWPTVGHAPMLAPPVVLPPLLEPLPAGKGWLRCVSTPVANCLYAVRQWFSPSVFSQFAGKFYGNPPLCNTQQGCSPPGEDMRSAVT
jgi:galactokinase